MDILIIQWMICGRLCLASNLLKAVFAVDRLLWDGFERHLGLDTTGTTGDGKHLTFYGKNARSPWVAGPALDATGLTPDRFMTKTFLSIELLFLRCKTKLRTTVLAD